MDPRVIYEENEYLFLSPRAVKSRETKGRQMPLDVCPVRTEFQRDRDRIIHCKSFRRLKHKTQVFLAPEGDHFRTRLTHTLEVSQIARTIARGLRLNEDLAEAISLGHDLGHTPFGHSGEAALAQVSPTGFKHYEHSLRVVDILERDRAGLNLTYEVRNGILRHTCDPLADTLEGQIVRYADHIAYMNHDIDDAEAAGVMKSGELPKRILEGLGKTHSARITTMITAVLSASEEGDVITMEPEIKALYDELHTLLYERVYHNPLAKGEENRAKDAILRLYEYFVKNKDALPESYKKYIDADGIDRVVCDYIAGMTDTYLINTYEEIFIPKRYK